MEMPVQSPAPVYFVEFYVPSIRCIAYLQGPVYIPSSNNFICLKRTILHWQGLQSGKATTLNSIHKFPSAYLLAKIIVHFNWWQFEMVSLRCTHRGFTKQTSLNFLFITRLTRYWICPEFFDSYANSQLNKSKRQVNLLLLHLSNIRLLIQRGHSLIDLRIAVRSSWSQKSGLHGTSKQERNHIILFTFQGSFLINDMFESSVY